MFIFYFVQSYAKAAYELREQARLLNDISTIQEERGRNIYASSHQCTRLLHHWKSSTTRSRRKRWLLLLSEGGGGGRGGVPSGQSLQWWTDWAGSRREPKNKHCVSDLALQLEKRQKHTYTQNALLLRCQCETERETEDLTVLDINWRLQLHSHHSSFYGPSGLVDGGFAVLVCCWALKLCLIQSGMRLFRLSLKTISFFFFYWCWPLWG